MDDELERVLMLSRESYQQELEKQLTKGIDLHLQIQTLDNLLHFGSKKFLQYEEYLNYSDIIILPHSYMEQLKIYINNLDNNKPIVLECLGLKFTVLDFQNSTHFAYISKEYYNKLRSLLYMDLDPYKDPNKHEDEYINEYLNLEEKKNSDLNDTMNYDEDEDGDEDEDRMDEEMDEEIDEVDENTSTSTIANCNMDNTNKYRSVKEMNADKKFVIDKSVICLKCLFTTIKMINNIKKVILEPLNSEFLETTNQLELFENNIGKHYRVLEIGQTIYSSNKQQKFNVIKIICYSENSSDNELEMEHNMIDNPSSINVGYCVDTDIIIDFFIPEIKLKEWERILKEKKETLLKSRDNKLKELNTIKYNGNSIQQIQPSSNVLGTSTSTPISTPRFTPSSNVLGTSTSTSTPTFTPISTPISTHNFTANSNVNNNVNNNILSKEELRKLRLSKYNK
jgi:hypothetical protein